MEKTTGIVPRAGTQSVAPASGETRKPLRKASAIEHAMAIQQLGRTSSKVSRNKLARTVPARLRYTAWNREWHDILQTRHWAVKDSFVTVALCVSPCGYVVYRKALVELGGGLPLGHVAAEVLLGLSVVFFIQMLRDLQVHRKGFSWL